MSVRLNAALLKTQEKKILDYYEKGYSQKDIRTMTGISLPRIRKILIENQCPTKHYRAISSETKDIIELLVYHQYSYRIISLILNISFHVIRELPETRDLRISNIERFRLEAPLHDSLYQEFLTKYENGASFLELYHKHSLGLQDTNPLADKIMKDPYTLTKHQEHLEKRICYLLTDHPVHMIAKQLNISVSIVKEQQRFLQKKMK